ncbi:MAG: cytochrome c [Pseudomonadota bacterium]
MFSGAKTASRSDSGPFTALFGTVRRLPSKCIAVLPVLLVAALSGQSNANEQEPLGPGESAVITYEVIDGERIADPLTSNPPDAERGAQIVADPALGNCLSCHRIGALGSGERPLDGIGSRLSAAELRLWIVNPLFLSDDRSKPAYYRIEDQKPGAEQFSGRPALTAQQIEDVIAYLGQLTEPGQTSQEQEGAQPGAGNATGEDTRE